MGFSGGSGNSGSLATLTDAALNSPANQQLLSYSSSTQKWSNVNISSVGAITSTNLDGSTSDLINNADSATVGALQSSFATIATVAAKYTKPSNGIPATDLVSSVQTTISTAVTSSSLDSSTANLITSTSSSVYSALNSAYATSGSVAGKYTLPSGGIPTTDLASSIQTTLSSAITSTNQDSTVASLITNTSSSTNSALAGSFATAASVSAKYTKPSSGIPATDLASAVQTTLSGAVTSSNLDSSTAALINNSSSSTTTALAAGYATVAAVAAKYTKPSGGIPFSDLSTATQNSIALPANYLRTVKPANTSITSSTTTTADPDLSVSVVANAKYVFELLLVYEADNAGDIKLGLNAPSGATIFGISSGVSASTTLSTVPESPMTLQYIHTVNSAFGSLGGVGAGTAVPCRISGTLTTGSTAGSFSLAWAQNASSTVATILYLGSEFSATRIS